MWRTGKEDWKPELDLSILFKFKPMGNRVNRIFPKKSRDNKMSYSCQAC
jgi:hypothetical protein